MDNQNYIKIKEGVANFYIHKNDAEQIPSKSMNVFYNKRMIINRDITILSLLAYQNLYNQKPITIVDSMAASGIGSIRISLECKGIKKIYINDMNPITLNLIEKNLHLNQLNNSNIEIVISNKDANFLFSEINQNHMLKSDNSGKADVISIDPFGTPNIYLDAAFKALKKSMSLICITATDTAVLFGIKPDACFRKYLSKSLYNEYSKEIGARILLHFTARIANVNRLGIIPLLTFYSQHFIRIFCLTFKNVKKINESFDNYGYIIHCNKCGFRRILNYNIINTELECLCCNSQNDISYAGPLWVGEIHQKEFIELISELNQELNLPNKKRLAKILNYIGEEINMPFSYYNVHKLCKELKIKVVPKLENIIEGIRNLGYQASRTHFDFTSIKTNLNIFDLKNLFHTNHFK